MIGPWNPSTVRALCVGCSFVLALAGAARAQEPAATFADAVQAAELIAFGELIAQGAEGLPPDAYTFVVYTPFTGLPATVDVPVVVAPGDPMLAALTLGEWYVLFLEPVPGSAAYRPVASGEAVQHVARTYRTSGGEWLWELQARVQAVLGVAAAPAAARTDARFRTVGLLQEEREPLEASPAVGATVHEDFTAGSLGAGWTVGDATGTGVQWGVQAEGTDSSVWCAGGGPQERTAEYANTMHTWLRYGPVALSDAQHARLTFRYRGRTERGSDVFRYGVSLDGVTWTFTTVSGAVPEWTEGEVALGQWGATGSATVWVQFEFTSDGTGTEAGVWVDDVVLAAADCPPTEAPADVSASDAASCDRVELTWTRVPEVQSYHVYRSATATRPGTPLATVIGPPYVDTTAAPGTTYTYWVQVVDACDTGAVSDPDTGLTLPPPATPAPVDASDGAVCHAIRVEWPTMPHATSYRIYRSSTTTRQDTPLATVGGPPYFDVLDPDRNPLIRGQAYNYWVEAVNSCGTSGVAGPEAGSLPTPPPAPTNVTASDSDACDPVRLDWDLVPEAVRYNIYIPWVPEPLLIGTVSAPPFNDNGAPFGCPTTYFVTAVDRCGLETWGPLVVGRRGVRLPDPPNLTASDGVHPDRVDVAWDPVPGAALYSVYRGELDARTGVVLYSPLASVSPPVTSYADTSVTPGTIYYYAVSAHATCAGSCAAVDTGFACVVPTVQTLGASTKTDCDRILLQWGLRPRSPAATSFRIFRSETTTRPVTPLVELPGSVVEYIDSDVTRFTTYYYWVQPVNACAPGPASGPASGIAGIVPGTPGGITATDATECGAVVLTWRSSINALSYRVFRSETPTRPATPLASVTDTAYRDAGVTADTTYHYWVQAVGECEDSEFGGPATGVAGTLPPPPGGVSASNGDDCVRIRVAWQSLPGATSYNIYRAGTPTLPERPIATVAGPPYDDTTGQRGVDYYYWVQGVSCDVGTPVGPDLGYLRRPLAAPGGMNASDGLFCDRVQVGWTAVSGATEYRVYRSETTPRPTTPLGTTPATTYADTEAEPAITYHYWVEPVGPCGSGPVSGPTTGLRPALPAAPTRVTASDGQHAGKIQVTWPAAESASSYAVYRSTTTTRPATPLATVPGTMYDDTAAAAGTQYVYWVQALNPCNEGHVVGPDAGWYAGPCTLAVTEPNGGRYMPGTTVPVRWSGGTTSGGDVRIQLQRRTRRGWKTWTVAGGTPHDGSYDLRLPDDWPKGKYRVRVLDVADPRRCRAESAVFRVTACTLEVLAPSGGEVYAPGDPVSILWQGITKTAGPVSVVLLKKTRTGWKQVATLAASTANDGSLESVIPADARTGKYRLRIADTGAPRACRANSMPFFIRR